MRAWAGMAAAFYLLVAGRAAALPACAGPVEMAHAHVVRVEKNGDVILADGQAIHLESIRLPAGAADHAPVFLAAQAIATLNDLIDGTEVVLTAREPKEDRYGRLRAQAFFSDGHAPLSWLQVTMLRRGLARVSLAPDRGECASELYVAEAAARSARQGIWTSEAYEVRTPYDLASTAGTFQIVEGRVLSAHIHDGRTYLDFGPDWRSDFKATIAPADMAQFRDAGVDPRTYEGLTVRVRGFVDWFGGPEIELASPSSVEVVDAQAKSPD